MDGILNKNLTEWRENFVTSPDYINFCRINLACAEAELRLGDIHPDLMEIAQKFVTYAYLIYTITSPDTCIELMNTKEAIALHYHAELRKIYEPLEA